MSRFDVYLLEKKQAEISRIYNISINLVWKIKNKYGRYRDIVGNIKRTKVGRELLSSNSKPRIAKSQHAGIVPCLKCEKPFRSPNRREFRICPKCSKQNEQIFNNLGYDYIYDVECIFDDDIK